MKLLNTFDRPMDSRWFLQWVASYPAVRDFLTAFRRWALRQMMTR